VAIGFPFCVYLACVDLGRGVGAPLPETPNHASAASSHRYQRELPESWKHRRFWWWRRPIGGRTHQKWREDPTASTIAGPGGDQASSKVVVWAEAVKSFGMLRMRLCRVWWWSRIVNCGGFSSR